MWQRSLMGESFEAHAWKLAYQWRWAALCFTVWCKWKHKSDRQEDSCFQQGYFCSRVSFFNIINIKTIYPVPPPRFTTNKAISMNEKLMLCPKLHTWHTSSQQIVLWGTNFYAIASSQNTHCIYFFSHRKRRRCWSCDFFDIYKHVVGTMWTLYDTQTKSTAQDHYFDSSL